MNKENDMNLFDQRRRQMLRVTAAALCTLAIPCLAGCDRREAPRPNPTPPASPPETDTTMPRAAPAEPTTNPSAPPESGPVKVTQASVRYQNQPKGDQKCATCMQFVQPDGCKVVDGRINPEGWCIVWAKKA
jgi:hypothetical protein